VNVGVADAIRQRPAIEEAELAYFNAGGAEARNLFVILAWYGPAT